MNYKDFKTLIEKKSLNREEYLKLKEKLGQEEIKELFEKYIIEEDTINNEDKFKYIESYYYEEIESEQFTENISEELIDSYNKDNLTTGDIDYYSDDIIKQYITNLPNIPLLTADEEKELATKMNYLYDTLRKKIIYSNNEYKTIIKESKSENVRDIEEVLIDNYLNKCLNELKYPKVLKIKSYNKKDSYTIDTSKDERIKHLKFLKKEINKRVEVLKELKQLLIENPNKIDYIKEIELISSNIDYIKEIYDLLKTQVEYLSLFEKFFESNIKLALKIAGRYKKDNHMQIDIIQAANLGLIKAIKKFEPEKGYKFSTYATWWIKQGITRYRSNYERPIRIPVHALDTLNKINATKRKLEAAMGEEPTAKEIALVLNLPVEKVNELLMIDYVCTPVSIETKVGPEDDCSTLAEFIPNNTNTQDEVGEQTLDKSLTDELNRALSTLTEREEQVLRLRFGLDDGSCKTLEEVGQVFGVTRERIRQIESKALRKLRHPSRSRKLKDF